MRRIGATPEQIAKREELKARIKAHMDANVPWQEAQVRLKEAQLEYALAMQEYNLRFCEARNAAADAEGLPPEYEPMTTRSKNYPWPTPR